MAEQDPRAPLPENASPSTTAQTSASPATAVEMPAGESAHPEKPNEKSHGREKKPRRKFGRVLWTGFVRVYTLALALSIAFVCFSAIFYLFKYVFTPAKLPPALTQWQGHLEPAALRQTNVPGITGGAGRAPIGHYHKVDRWFQSDPLNGCTAAGCHEPLPHEQKSKIAAFANLHVTFLDCMVCHDKSAANPGRISSHWIGIADYRQQESPAVLRLMGVLDQLAPDMSKAAALHPQIVSLLKDVQKVVGADPELRDLLIQIESTLPNSPLWKKSVQQLTRELPRHARGEYSAKIAREGAVRDVKALAEQTRAFLAEKRSSNRRGEIKTAIHKDVLEHPSACATCHSKENNSMLDFAAMGYSPARAKSLRELPLARMVQQIRDGETFQLPKLLEGPDGK